MLYQTLKSIASKRLLLLLFPFHVLAAEQVVELSLPVPRRSAYERALLVNTGARKLYAGSGGWESNNEKGLWVFDIDRDGSVTGSDERLYAQSPDPPFTDHIRSDILCTIRSMALNPKLNLLYLLGGHKMLFAMPLKNGEPGGEPLAWRTDEFTPTLMLPNERFDAVSTAPNSRPFKPRLRSSTAGTRFS